jgi:hypothetical protein
MANNFDLKKYLIENRMTSLSKHSKQHPDTITYRGAKYQRIGLINESPYFAGIEPEGSVTQNYTVFSEYGTGAVEQTSIQAVNLVSAFQKWFNKNLNNPIMDAMMNPSEFFTFMRDEHSTYGIDNRGEVFGFPILCYQWATDSPNIIVAENPPKQFINSVDDMYKVCMELDQAGYWRQGG